MSIGDGAFSAYGLTSVTIPNSVTNIGAGPFQGCGSLRGINVDTNNPAYISIAGVLFNRNQTALIQYPAGNVATSYAIPGSVTNIGDDAFADCGSLTRVTIPDSVINIGDEAFYESGLTTVTLGNSVASIGDYAFGRCGLTSVTIPDSVTNIGVAFSGSGLTNVTIGSGVTSLESNAFQGCTSLTSITIPNNVTSIGDEAFGECYNLTSVTIPYSVTSPKTSEFEIGMVRMRSGLDFGSDFFLV